MLELSKFLSKSVLCIRDATYIGAVNNVYFENSCKKIAYFLISATDGKEELLPFDCISSFGDVLMIEDGVCLKNPLDIDVTALDFDILNKDVFTSLGDFKGRVERVEFTRSGSVAKICTNGTSFTPNTIFKVGDAIILKSAPKQQKKKITIPRPKTDYPVYILDDPSLNTNQENLTSIDESNEFSHSATTSADSLRIGVLQSAPPSIMLSNDSREPMLSSTAFKTLIGETDSDDEHTPARIICNFDFLMGRVLSRDLKTFAGEIIAYAGAQVDENVLRNARRAGKLVELTLNSEKA